LTNIKASQFKEFSRSQCSGNREESKIERENLISEECSFALTDTKEITTAYRLTDVKCHSEAMPRLHMYNDKFLTVIDEGNFLDYTFFPLHKGRKKKTAIT